MTDEGVVFWTVTVVMIVCAGWLFGGAFGWWPL